MTLLQHECWPELRPLVRVETYARDGGHAHPRRRLEVTTRGVEPLQLQRLVNLEVACVACGQPIHPVRRRRQTGTAQLYLAVTCALTTRMGCARSGAAAKEYGRIIDALAATA